MPGCCPVVLLAWAVGVLPPATGTVTVCGVVGTLLTVVLPVFCCKTGATESGIWIKPPGVENGKEILKYIRFTFNTSNIKPSPIKRFKLFKFRNDFISLSHSGNFQTPLTGL